MKVEKVFVMGGGTMGAGIAQVCAQSGLRVTLCEVSD
ncbi:MAG: 3-hydroxybutyryl-CoA dehydrogenase, partial [Deltaproteobacteria bacterium CG17_big_fil_post_rev_8_21_14_2_50_51_6]